MKWARRFLWFVVGVFLGGYSVYASANPSPNWTTNLTGSTTYSSSGAACNGAWTAHVNQYGASTLCPNGGNYCWTNGGVSADNSACLSNCAGSGCNTQVGSYASVGGSCASGYTFNQAAAACYSATCPAVGTNVSGWILATQSPAIVCFSGCEATIVQASDQYQLRASGQQTIVGTWSYDGQTCTGSNATAGGTSSTPDPVSCAKSGGNFGTVNGVPTCVPATASQPVTKTAASSSTTGNQTTTTSTTTTTNGTTVTTSTTTTPPSGTPTTTTQTQDQTDFCAANPNNAICQKSSAASGGGDCTAAPTCSGDAIACAQLNQEWLDRCAQYNEAKADASYTLGQQIASGNDPMKGSFPSVQNATTKSVGTLNTAETFAASCPPPWSFSVQGHSVSIDPTPICNFGSIIGAINLIFASLAAAYILGRS